jgi:hypothetical protein
MHAKLFMHVRAGEVERSHDRATDGVRALTSVNRSRGRSVAKVSLKDPGHLSRERGRGNRNFGPRVLQGVPVTTTSPDGPWDAA